MFKNTNIGPKLLMIGGLMILVPLLIIGTVSNRYSRKALSKAADEQLSTRSDVIAKLVNDVMRAQLRFTMALSVSSEVITAAEAFDRGDTVEISQALADVNTYFRRLLKTENLSNNVQLIGLVNMDGTISGASEKKYVGVRIPDRTYFQVAKSGKPNIGEIAINKVTGSPFLSFASPVQSAEGNVIGVLMYLFDIGFLNQLVVDEKIGDSGYAFMIDKTGLLIAHPNPKHLMKTNLTTYRGMETIVKYMRGGRSGVDRYTFEGIDKTAGYAPVESTGWSVGLNLPDDEYLVAVNKITTLVLVVGIISVLVAVVSFFSFSCFLVKRLQQGVVFAKAMSEGDLTGSIETVHGDEIGVLSMSLNEMVSQLSRMISKIHSGTSSLFITSSELRNVSEVLSAGSGNAANRSTSVAAAAEEMNTNIESVAAAMDQASTNVNNIAAAVEEMNANFGDITGRLNITRESTNRAADVSSKSSNQVNELGKAASEIEGITETIYNIADKTSLLALNATIEAARAGDAGKGFAVVAGEIKILAQQVSESTGDIAEKINAIQDTTDKTIQGIREIVEVISMVNESVDNITTAMQQQNHATQEISENINQTSNGIREINENVSQTSLAVAQVTSEINLVNQSANDLSESSMQVEKNADYLMGVARDLEGQVMAFKVNSTGFASGPVKLAHSNWKKKLSELLSGREQVAEKDIASHHNCEFGQWYLGEGVETFGGMDTFRQIDPSHEKVHTTAREIVRLYNSGHVDEATHLYREFTGITDKLFGLLDKLEEEIEQS